MTHIEAMKQGLGALEVEDMACRYEKEATPEYIAKAITSLRQAIAEAEKQEPKRLWLWKTLLTEDLNTGHSTTHIHVCQPKVIR